MAQAPRGFSIVEDLQQYPESEISQAPPQPSRVSAAIDGTAIRMMQMAMWELSKRAVVALASLFTLLTVGSAFYIWLLIINEPTQLQIVAASIFSTFVLLVNYLNMRRGK